MPIPTPFEIEITRLWKTRFECLPANFRQAPAFLLIVMAGSYENNLEMDLHNDQ
jgi:hypothetical protein